MKNDDQMYQSVLSRRDAYRLQQQKRTRTVKRLTPVLACFCFTIGLGLGIWKHQSNLPHVPVKTVTETTATTETTTTIAETTSTAVSEPSQIRQTSPTTSATVQTETVTEVCTTVTNAMTTASSQQTSTAAVTATAAPQTNLQTKSITTTVSAVATQSVTYIPSTVPPLTARITPQTSTMEVVTTSGTEPATVTTAATFPTTAETSPATTAETTEPIQEELPPQEPVDVYVAPLQFREIPCAIADIPIRLVEIFQTVALIANLSGNPFRRIRHQLHKPNSPSVRQGRMLKLTLAFNDRCGQIAVHMIDFRIFHHRIMVRIDIKILPLYRLKLQYKKRTKTYE